jgi:serine O-acetyltransferase
MYTVLWFYRLGHFFYNKKLYFLSFFISYFIRFFYSCWLPSSAIIGKNFKLGYGGLGVVIHNNTKIGNNVTICQNVTIGKNLNDIHVPIIGNDVYIGTGSVIFGEIFIGNNVIIGSNSLVNINIPDNCTVVGNPCRIIKSNRYYKYYEKIIYDN